MTIDQPQHGNYAWTETGRVRHIARTRKQQGVILRRRDERTLCGRQVYAWSFPHESDTAVCSRCAKTQAGYLFELQLTRYTVAQGTPSLGGWVVWDDVPTDYLRGEDGQALRFPSRAEAVAKVAALLGHEAPYARVCGAMIPIRPGESVPCRAPMDERGECVVSTLHAGRVARKSG